MLTTILPEHHLSMRAQTVLYSCMSSLFYVSMQNCSGHDVEIILSSFLDIMPHSMYNFYLTIKLYCILYFVCVLYRTVYATDLALNLEFWYARDTATTGQY